MTRNREKIEKPPRHPELYISNTPPLYNITTTTPSISSFVGSSTPSNTRSSPAACATHSCTLLSGNAQCSAPYTVAAIANPDRNDICAC